MTGSLYYLGYFIRYDCSVMWLTLPCLYLPCRAVPCYDWMSSFYRLECKRLWIFWSHIYIAFRIEALSKHHSNFFLRFAKPLTPGVRSVTVRFRCTRTNIALHWLSEILDCQFAPWPCAFSSFHCARTNIAVYMSDPKSWCITEMAHSPHNLLKHLHRLFSTDLNEL